MQKVVLKTRFLNDKEIEALTKDIYDFPDLIYVGKNVWRKKRVHVIEVAHRFAGVLVDYHFGRWVKLGPVVILKKYQGKGLGKTLLKRVIGKYKNKNLSLNTTNPHIKRIAIKLGFKETPGYFYLPLSVKVFLIKQLFDYLGIINIKEAVRKKLTAPRNNRSYFLKYSP